jgi:hypothetical protein
MTTLRSHDVILTTCGDQLRVDAPEGVLSDEMRQAIRHHKAALLAWLAQRAPAHDAAATALCTLEMGTHQAHVPLPPPPYPGRPMGTPFRPGQQVWLYRWDHHAPRFDVPVTVVQMRTLWPGEQDIGWCDAAGEVSWHNARLAVAVGAQEAERRSQDDRAYCAAASVAGRCGA